MFKRTFKIFLVTLLTMAFTAPAVLARGKGHGRFLNASVLQAMLDLRDDQANKVKQIDDKYKGRYKTLRKKVWPMKKELKKYLFSDQVNLETARKKFKEIADLKVEMRMLAIERRLEVEKILDYQQKQKLRKIIKAKYESRRRDRK